jgi:uncharacterized protein DUF4012
MRARADERAVRRRRWPWIVAIAIVLCAGAALDAGWSGAKARDELVAARDALVAGADALQSGDLTRARSEMDRAAEAARSASSRLSHPGVAVAGLAPGVSDDVDAARRVADAAVLAASAGGHLVDAASAAGWSGGNLPGFAPGGRIDPSVFTAAAPALADASEELERAAASVTAIDTAGLVGPLHDAVAQVADEVTRSAGQAARLADAADLLPAMLGADRPRTYLLVSFNTSDPRGVGGYPGGYGLLRTDGARVSLDTFRPTSSIPKVRAVDAPRDIARRWGIYGSLTTFWNTTYVADFPTAASLMRSIWTAGGGQPVDGVIGADPAMLAAMLRVVGPVGTVLGRDTFRTLDQKLSDAWQVGIGSAAWQAILERPWPATEMGAAVSSGVADRHLFVYSDDVEEEESLRSLGVAGEVPLPPDPMPLVVPIGFTDNRTGFFARFDSDVATTSTADGTEVTLTVTLHNDAPSPCPPSILCGRSSDLIGGPLGSFGADVDLYLPETARDVRMEVDGKPWSWFTGLQPAFGRKITAAELFAPPQGSSVGRITYLVPTAG